MTTANPAISPETFGRLMRAHVAHHTAPALRSGDTPSPLFGIVAGFVLVGAAVLALI